MQISRGPLIYSHPGWQITVAFKRSTNPKGWRRCLLNGNELWFWNVAWILSLYIKLYFSGSSVQICLYLKHTDHGYNRYVASAIDIKLISTWIIFAHVVLVSARNIHPQKLYDLNRTIFIHANHSHKVIPTRGKCYTDPAWLSLTNERKFVD